MKKRIFRSMFLASLIVIILVSSLVVFTLYDTFEVSAKNDLRSEADYIKGKLSGLQNESSYFSEFYSINRVTFIASDGAVIYDNTINAATMENHSNRPEVAVALVSGTGESSRYSNTLAEYTIYYALRTNDGNVLRISKTQSSVLGLLWNMLPALIAIIFGVAALSALVARLMSKRIIAPINALDLDKPFDNDIYDELSPLLLRIERQHHEIENRHREISGKQREFTAVTENMREGLILLSTIGNILSINKSAIAIFEANGVHTGDHILTVNRSAQLQSVYEGALKGTGTEGKVKINGRYYQLLGNPAGIDGGTAGAVIMILDITDKQNAERSRREFTANVSHELKTPLTSISGFAEIMKNGTAKPEDMQGFAARIHQEASRLIALVEDILRLSQLDEKAKLPDKDNVDLFVLAEEVIGLLHPLAERQGISLSAQGEHIVISGYRKILEEMLYNLCDNAIKYNKLNGSVTMTVRYSGKNPAVIIEDTGIGIPEEHQPHVFERFYRVDKSRSKETGGTGLGLSIVKHGAIIHDAEIKLNSSLGIGTIIEITFPKQNYTT